MQNNAFLQHPGQIPDKSTTVWSTPKTEEQKRFFSRHAPKRRVYGLIMTVLQGIHILFAFAAWNSNFEWIFSKAPVLLPVAPYAAALSLLALHILFRVSWDTYWYDRMDNNDRTDSSIFIPLIIIGLLLYSEAKGVEIFLEGQVKPVAEKTISPVDDRHQAQIDLINKEYKAQIERIESVYKQKISAAALPYENRITALKRRKIDDESERKSIYNQIESLKNQRNTATAPVIQAKAAELEKALAQNTQDIAREKGVHASSVQSITTHNSTETKRYQTEMSDAGSFAWIISGVILALIAALGYVRVRINVKSGILPLRNFTVLDAHGSLAERMQTAFSDAMNRQGLRLAVWFHRTFSPKGVLSSFDGTVITRQGQYNTPEGMFTEANTPAPPSPTEQLGEAWAKVFSKLERIQGIHPGYVPNNKVLQTELNKALSMNGSYAGDAWDDPSLGKP